MKTHEILLLVFSIAICLSAGFIGSLFTMDAIPTWYATLNKPLFSPPNWLFAPMWTLLYILMGTALFLVWKKSKDKKALELFTFQLILNAFWSIAFFGMKSPLFGLLVIALLWLAIVLTIRKFLTISIRAGILLVPYILWVSFAAILNLAIFLLNP